MTPTELHELLDQVRAGTLPVSVALQRLQTPPVVDLGYAQVDLDRAARCGFPEVIFCQGKSADWIGGVIARLHQAGQDCLGTRLDPTLVEPLRHAFPHAEFDALARTVWLPQGPPRPPVGRVVVVTAGTTDLPVAQEAVVTARVFGCGVELIADVGVAGLHRLLRQAPRLTSADVVITVAGMENALASVVGGLVDCPVLAVPTSVGYGAAFGGVAALLGALNSCSAGVAVVNIDAGFKAGYLAAVIIRRLELARRAGDLHHQTGDSAGAV